MHELNSQLARLEPHPSLPALSGNGRTRNGVAETVLPDGLDETLRIVVWMPGGADDVVLQAYSEYLAGLLHGKAVYRQDQEAGPTRPPNEVLQGGDLLLFGEPQQSLAERLLFGLPGRSAARRVSSAILVARHPQHPLRRILLILRVEAFEESAVAWAGCLAQASGAQLRILPLVPAQPSIYGPGSRLQIGLDSLLAPNTHCGEQLRTFLRQLEQWHVQSTLRVRQGDPLWQACWEIDEGHYDLIIIGAEQHRQLEHLLFGELVGPLLSRVQRPLLIAATRLPDGLHPRQTRAEEPGAV